MRKFTNKLTHNLVITFTVFFIFYAYAITYAIVNTQLIISEVYFAGTDERIEVTNISEQEFSGDIVISGAKSSNISLQNITIEPAKQILFGDKLNMILDKELVMGTGLALSIYDSRDLLIELINSGKILDSISASANELAIIKPYKASLQKIQSGTVFLTTGSQKFSGYNVVAGYIANPGIIYTGNYKTGFTNTGDNSGNSTGDNVGDGCLDFDKKIKITEIFLGDEKYPPYIEIQAIEDFNGNILFSGDAIFSSFQITTTLQKDRYLIISNNNSGWLSTLDTHIESSFGLDKPGSGILLYGQGGQLLDSISMVFGTGELSIYQNNIENCSREFSRINKFSPGFSQELLVYFSTGYVQYIEVEIIVEKIVEVEKIIYINTGCLGTGFDCSLCISTGDNNEIGSGGYTTGGVTPPPQNLTNGQFIKIVSIDYNPPGSDVGNEKVVLKSKVNYIVNVDHMRLHSLSRTTNNRIYGNIQANSQQEFIGNYRFPNSANCVELLSGDVILDTYCYDPADEESTTTSDEIEEGSQDSDENGQEEKDWTQYKITIENLVYDASGSDTNREQIVLNLQDDSSLGVLTVDDLKSLKLLIKTENIENKETVEIKTRKTKLFYEDLNNFSYRDLGDTKTFTGNFRFPNTKNTCVSLIQNEYIFDTWCYDIATKKNNEPKKTKQEDVMPKTLYGTIKIVSILPNPIGTDAGSEQITLLFKQDNYKSSYMSDYLSGFQNLVMDENFRLIINTQNKKISGMLKNNIETTLTGSFAFPNNAACVSLIYYEKVLDTFCYEKPNEGELFTKKNGQIERLSTIDLTILQKSSFKKINNKICLFYKEQMVHCKNYKFGKTYSATYNELRLYKNYINILNNYLGNNWPTLFFNSPLNYYQNLFKKIKEEIKLGNKTRTIYGESFDIYDIEAQAKELVFATPTEILQRKILSQFIPENIRKQYYFIVQIQK